MPDAERQKDAMDVLQAWVDDYNGRARPTIRLGSAGEGAAGPTRAFLWQEQLGIVDLKPLTGVSASANDINEHGAIAGGGDTGFGDFHAYLLSEGTSFDLGTLGGNESEALAVNRRGQVAGHSRVAGAPAKRALFIPEPGRMVHLGAVGGATRTGRGVNDRREVVGFAETAAGQPH